jgi:hypothetical protein
MRMRYERRDPRPEDLRHIEELKNIVESQERDICHLTEQLRELQLTQQQLLQQTQFQQPNGGNGNGNNGGKRGKNKNNRNNNNNRNSQQQQQQEERNLMQQQLQQQQLLKKQQLHKSSCNVIYEENENELEQNLEKAENQELRNGESLNENVQDLNGVEEAVAHQVTQESQKEEIEIVQPTVIQTSNDTQSIPKTESNDSIPESNVIPKVESTDSVPDQNRKLSPDGSIELSDATDFEIVPATVLEMVDNHPQINGKSESNNSKMVPKDEVITDANVIAVVSAAVTDNLDLD